MERSRARQTAGDRGQEWGQAQEHMAGPEAVPLSHGLGQKQSLVTGELEL